MLAAACVGLGSSYLLISGDATLSEVMPIVVGVVLLVIGAAAVGATLLIRAMRGPVDRASEVARRVAAGDLSARIGELGEGEFAEFARSFDQMAMRLEGADHDQRQFLADVAHEIATPMNAIQGFAVALADGTMSSLQERKRALELIESQQGRLESLLSDLRELTQLDLTSTVQVESLDLGDVCAGAVTRFAPVAERAGVEFKLARQPRRSLILQSDRRLLETVLDNLVSNAIRYTPRGGRVELSPGRTDRSAVIAVSDSGIGIAPEHQKRVFDRLYRGDCARDRSSGGSGLGLAIAQRAARALGGRIELESQPDVGSVFRLVFPLLASRRARRRAERDEA
jgi:two-component system, OmpR family, sensor histidine kinase BaeS